MTVLEQVFGSEGMLATVNIGNGGAHLSFDYHMCVKDSQIDVSGLDPTSELQTTCLIPLIGHV